MDKLDFELEEQEQPIKTGWSNPPTLADLKHNLMDATSHHDSHVSKVNTWLDNLNVTGSAKITKIKGRSTMVPKLIRKQAEWRYAALSEAFLSSENIFQTEPLTWEDKTAAIQNGLILNNQFNTQIDKVEFIDEYVRTAVDEGTIIVRVGWDFQEEEVEVPNIVPMPVTDPAHLAILLQAAQMVLQQPEGIEQLPPELASSVQATLQTGQPTQMVIQGTKKEMRTLVNQPTVEVCDFNSVIIDPSCKGKLKKANFIIFKFETNLSDLRKAGIYSNLDAIETERTAIQTETTYKQEDIGSFNFQDKPRKKFLAYEYWGFWDTNNTGKTSPIVATWVGNTLIRLSDSPFPDEGLPFILVQYLPKRKHVYGEPDGELLEDNQKIAGAVTRGMMDILGRSAAGQTGIRKDALDVTNQRKFDAGNDYSYNAHIDPATAFHTHVYPEIPVSAQFMLQLQNNDAEALTGVKAFHGGISGEGLGRSATAARSALDAASKRELGILRRLAKGMIDIGRKIMAMNGEFLSEEEIVRVTNEEFVKIKRDDLAGRVDIKLHISTAETDKAKAEELAFMLQTMGNNMPPEMSQMILADIARLQKMPELAKRLAEYKPEPDPMMQEMKALELEKLKAEIEEIRSRAVENIAQSELDKAKAKESSSKADLTDLNFVEQESGTKQARDLEMSGSQAQANMERDIVKEMIKGGNGSGAKTPA